MTLEDLTTPQKTGLAITPPTSVLLIMVMNWHKRTHAYAGEILKSNSMLNAGSFSAVPIGAEGITALLMITLFILMLVSVSLNFLPSTQYSNVFNTGLYLGVGIAAIHHAVVASMGVTQFTPILLLVAVISVDRINSIWQ